MLFALGIARFADIAGALARSVVAMAPSSSYHDAVWEALPQGLVPERAALRKRFLVERVRREHARLGRPPRVLDVGCGDGWFAAALAAAGAEPVAVDVAAEAVRRACAAHPDLDARLVAADAELPFADADFDVVWAGETIEHVADTAAWLSELRRVLRSGGVLLLSTPDHGPLTRLRLALWPPAFEAHFDPRSDHLRFYTRRSLYNLLADFGYEELEVFGAGGVPGARRALLAAGRRSRF
ncbi:MAG TPA: class I SAM-dependent methyltransferase [Solirubrobacteraceae bacterium]|nr:class I SAM-dependent methyltransferase [Solirubrobacteraceae bacterium]